MVTPTLSKSRFINGSQCHLRLWHDHHASHLAKPPSPTLQTIFKTGHEVGELACARHPGGYLIAHDHRHTEEALEETAERISQDTLPALFEAAFSHQGLFSRADIIERLPDDGWRLIEVKSTTRNKDVFLLDLAFQLRLMRGAGLDVRDAGVLTLNRDYIYDGQQLDLDALFRYHPCFEQADAMSESVGHQAEAMHALIAQEHPPDIAPGDHCFTPYPCPYHAHCTQGQQDTAQANEKLPALTPQQHDYVKRALASVAPPIRHLDFETFAPAIPRFAGTRPYDAIPFLFSVHTERDGADPIHTDYLHTGDDDPRPHIADHLIEALGSDGSICTYSGYERRVIKELIAALPDRADALRTLEARLFDLYRPIRIGYYHSGFRGSFSLKNMLPLLSPNSGYDDLAIADGQTAAARYSLALHTQDQAEQQSIFDDLRAYCERDTLASITIRQALANL
ncbi:MAG: DUF2779 domain-containing protein [Gammaproteobacteria bacterium]|nr:DUF2779 domain-containing protein [Gammaproteobacteria bacterium]